MSGPTYFTNPPPFARRYQPAAAYHEGECFILGGWDGQYFYSDAWRTLDGDPGGAWGRLYGYGSGGANPFIRRAYLSAQSFNGHLHFVGGYNPDATGKVLRDHWSYVEGGRGLTRWNTPGWEAREAYGLAASAGRMLLSGGVTYLNPNEPGTHLRCFADVWEFDLNGDWSLVLDNAPWGRRRSHGWEFLDGYWWLFGGFDSYNTGYSDLWRWDGVNAPVQMSQPPWSGRGVFFTCAANGELWVMGGVEGVSSAAYMNDVWSYDLTADTWTQHSTPPWSVRAGNRCVVVPGSPDKIVLVGGLGGTPSNRIWQGDVWSTTDGDNWVEEAGSTLHVA